MRASLDTNAYWRLMAKHEPLVRYVEEADEIFVSATVVGELYAGFRLGTRQAVNCAELKHFLSLPGVRVLPTSVRVAERYGALVAELRRAGTPIPTNDIWIAAATLEAGASLVSYDEHFMSVPGLDVQKP